MKLSNIFIPLGCFGILILLSGLFFDRPDFFVSVAVILMVIGLVGGLLKVYEKIRYAPISSANVLTPQSKVFKIFRWVLYALTGIILGIYILYVLVFTGFTG